MIERFSKLRLKKDNSDKEYTLIIEQKGSGFLVNYKYGKYGATTLRVGTKTTKPIPLDTAVKKFDRQLTKKLREGYLVLDGEKQPSVIKESKVQPKIASGFKGQWLNVITEEEAQALLEDDDWGLQEKKDGKRLGVECTHAAKGNKYTGINKQGLIRAIPVELSEKLNQKEHNLSFIVDGEWIDEAKEFWVFDLASLHGKSIKDESYVRRNGLLTELINLLNFQTMIYKVELITGTAAKKKKFKELKEAGAEGVVFKRLSAPLTSGRPNSGGDQRKFRFYDTASFIVKEVNVQRSVSLEVIDDLGGRIPAGNVCIPVNKKIPKVGDVVEVRYLYAFKDTGSLHQPVYLGLRDDVDAEECLASQLKYKVV